ncbi:MAG: DMT family transporter [Alphaproteobacteria bacterium]|nr:DMT family transporter [Alphaproteobacteria bacterium]
MTAPAQEAATSSPKEKVVAISVMCLASLCFIAMHGFIKSVRGDVPVGVILWSQFAFQAIILTALFARHLPRLLTPNKLGLQIGRAGAQIATICLMFIAVGLMQLADAIAIAFVAPLLITALSVAFLKEKVKVQHWLAILVGFAGVMIVIQPGAGVFNAVALWPLGAALCAAIYQTMTRPIARTVEPRTMLYTATLIGLVTTSAALPFFWLMPNLEQLAFLLAAACLGAMAHFLLIKAYQMAPASLVAPFSYSELIWASAIGFAAFGDVPTLTTLAGGAVLAASGLYLLRRQYK